MMDVLNLLTPAQDKIVAQFADTHRSRGYERLKFIQL